VCKLTVGGDKTKALDRDLSNPQALTSWWAECPNAQPPLGTRVSRTGAENDPPGGTDALCATAAARSPYSASYTSRWGVRNASVVRL